MYLGALTNLEHTNDECAAATGIGERGGVCLGKLCTAVKHLLATANFPRRLTLEYPSARHLADCHRRAKPSFR